MNTITDTVKDDGGICLIHTNHEDSCFACCLLWKIMAITLTLFPIKSQQLKPIYSVFHARLRLPTHTIHILHFYLLFNATIQFSFWKEFFSYLLLSSSLLSCFMYSRPDRVNQPVIKGPIWTTDHLCVCILLVLESLPWRIFPNIIHLACSWPGLNIEDSLYINFLLLRDKYT